VWNKSGLKDILNLMSHGPAQKTAPRDPRLRDAWRRACIVYRQCLREGHYEHISAHNARHALWLMVPELSYEQSAHEATQAISYCSVVNPKWLWDGTSGVPARTKMPFVPPHVIKDPQVLGRMEREASRKRTR
jgi:hypothetical protein